MSMIAIEATNEKAPDLRESYVAGPTPGQNQKRFGPGLDAATCSALKDLPYNSFRRIGDANAKADYNQEARLTINETYTLCIQPLSKDNAGLIRAKLWIEERRQDPKEPVRKVLMTTVKAVPGDKIILGGPNLKKGDLVVALTLKD
jgi:hypothetical protein